MTVLHTWIYKPLVKCQNEALHKYNDTCLNRTSLGPTIVFRIVRYSIYTGNINKTFPTLVIYSKFGL
jgi:hypothetical protein